MEILVILWCVFSTLIILANIYAVYILFNSQKLNRQILTMNDVVTTIGELNTSKQFRVKDLKDDTYRGWQIRTLVEDGKNAVLELQLLD